MIRELSRICAMIKATFPISSRSSLAKIALTHA